MLDTSTVILLGRSDNSDDLPQDSLVSAVTLAELSVGPHVAKTSKERVARQAHLQQAEADFETIPFDAATAIANDLPRYTCNPDDFAAIDELTVHPIPHPDRR